MSVHGRLGSEQDKGGKVDMTVHDDRGLLALQGPAAVETLTPLVDIDLSKMYFSNFAKLDIAGIPCYLTRTGYALSPTAVRSQLVNKRALGDKQMASICLSPASICLWTGEALSNSKKLRQ